MGLPITKYTLLKAVAEDMDIFHGSSSSKKLHKFRSFKLYGIILHDPVNHHKFHSKLGKEFELMDRLTGQDFLFMGLTDLPHEWVEDRQYYSEYKEIFAPNYRGIQEFKSEDPAITAFALAKALNIDYDDMPCILLTDDLRKNRFHVIRTSGNSLVEQLVKIGDYCSRTERPALMNSLRLYHSNDYPPHLQQKLWDRHGHDKDPAFFKLLKDIDLCNGSSLSRIESGLAEILSGILSTLAIHRNALGESIMAEDHLKSFLKEYTAKKPSDSEQPDIEILENRLLALAGLLANLGENQNNDFGLTLHAQCENESHIIIRTFNKVAPAYSTLSGTLLNNLDYSPLLICLGKVFEKELNLSVVHWVRNLLGLEMPDFFNKRKITDQLYLFSPSTEIVKNPEPVDFNGGFEEKWRPPFIGASEYIFKTLLLENKVPEEISEPAEFLKYWRKLRLFRNQAAHPEIISQEEFNEALQTFQLLNNSGKFAEMNSIKAKLKGSQF